MLNFRRLLVWLTLVGLTLFFAALGWRNWHLSNGEGEILLQSANLVMGRAKAPSYQVICENCDASQLSQTLKKRHTQDRFSVAKTGTVVKGAYMRLFAPEIHSRFYASCFLDYGGRNEDDYNAKCLFFTRSPVNPFDWSWHLIKVDESPH